MMASGNSIAGKSNMERKDNMTGKDLVYICSPLSAPTEDGVRENMGKAMEYARIVSGHYRCRAIAPHGFLPEYLDDTVPEERQVGLKFGLSILRVCKSIVVCGNRISSGMAGEIRKAKELGIPVYALVEYPDWMDLVRIAMVDMAGKKGGCA
jgi:hypothetical protein